MPDTTPLAQSASLSRHKRKLALALALALLCAIAWPTAKSYLQAIAVLSQVGGQPIPWYAAAVTQPVTTSDLQIPTPEGQIRARLYQPANHPNAPALVVFHGVHHLGMDEPRLVAFARAMSSCGLQVLTPELPGIKDYHVGQESVRVIGETTQWFARQTHSPVGVMGLSFSGGLALLAAADPQFHPAFKFVFAVGAQDAMDHVERFYLTGRELRPDGTTQVLRPHEYGALVLEYEHLEDFVPAPDLEAVRSVLRQHLYEDKAAEQAAAARVTPVQQAEVQALIATTSPATLARLAATQASHEQEMDGLSPQGHLKTLTTPVYLLHGQADNIIPAAETLWMASELPPTTLKAELVSPVLSHLDLDAAKPSLVDNLHLMHFLALVMQAAHS